MNYSDLLVIAIIGGFAFIGYRNGFIFSLFKIVSFFLAAILSIKLYPLMAKVLINTPLYGNIKSGILHNLLRQHETQTPGIDSGLKNAAADKLINELALPGFLKNTIISQMPNPSSLMNPNKVMEAVSDILARIAIDVISLVLIYILIRIAFIFIRSLLQGVAKLPLFKQMDKAGGLAFGAVEGLLTIYIVFAVLMLLHTVPQFKGLYDAIDNSLIARFFYENNFIIDWAFPKGEVIT